MKQSTKINLIKNPVARYIYLIFIASVCFILFTIAILYCKGDKGMIYMEYLTGIKRPISKRGTGTETIKRDQ